MIQRATQTPEYWGSAFSVTEEDLEHLLNLFFEDELPRTEDELGLNNWIDYFDYIINVEKGIALRNNSLHSLAWNLSHLLFPRSSTPMLVTSTNLLVGGFTALMIAWIVKRYLQRRCRLPLLQIRTVTWGILWTRSF